ncbi:VOC family protein [Streptomyces sp. NPDC048603]|uniref:VOC family protein n=1 Tax=Streptomyces sp. NPDC048603 TaxID=3365577 RepID=UPI003711651D
MAVELNHTIVFSRDKRESAEFLAHVLGLEIGVEWGPFIQLDMSNGVGLDFATVPAEMAERMIPQHYAFLISDEEFDAAFERIRARGITYYADPQMKRENEINHEHGGRGLYFRDPSGHGMEIITRPYDLTGAE